MTFFWIFENILVTIPPPKKRRLPSSTRPPAASRCRHVPSAQQHYDVPAKERASVPHLGEGETWNRPPGDGSLAPPPLFLRRCPLLFFSNSNYIRLNFRIDFWPLEPWTERAMDTRRQARLRQQQAQQHQDQAQQRPAVAARRAGGWWVEDGPPAVSCFIQGPQEPTK